MNDGARPVRLPFFWTGDRSGLTPRTMVRKPMGEAMSATTMKSAGLASRPIGSRAAKYALPTIARPAGLYDPEAGKASCGIGFVVNLRKEKSHKIVDDGLQILLNLEHRGAVGADKLM